MSKETEKKPAQRAREEASPQHEDGSIRCMVREGNMYGRKPAGTVVFVRPEEFARVGHCLVKVDDEGRQIGPKLVQAETVNASVGNKQFDSMRNMFRQNTAARRNAEVSVNARQAKLEAEIAANQS